MRSFMTITDDMFYGDSWWGVLWRLLMRRFVARNDENFYEEDWGAISWQ